MEYLKRYVEIGKNANLRSFLLKYETMYEAWNSTTDLNYLFLISKNEKILNKEKLARIAILFSERSSYHASHDQIHRNTIDSAKNWLNEQSEKHKNELKIAIQEANNACMEAAKKVGEYTKMVHADINKIASTRTPTSSELAKLNNLHEVNRPKIVRIKIISSGRAAAYASYYEDLDDVIGAVKLAVEDLCSVNITQEYQGELCRVFRDIVKNPFDQLYSPSKITEFVQRKLYDRIMRFLYR